MTQTNTLDYRNVTLSATIEPDPLFYGLTASAWLKVLVVSVLMAATFRFNLLRLWLKTNPFFGEPNWRHAVCVPLVGLYYLYVNRDDLLAIPTRTSWSGLGILFLGILLFVYGIYPGQNDFVKDFGMVVALFGVVTLLCGWPMMKLAWFPIVFLVCAIPWPDQLYSIIASPLQHLAASVAVGTLRFASVTAENSGTKIIMAGKDGMHTLNVAEACAGLRSLMTFISVGGAVSFLSSRPFWQKLLITASAVPIAVFCNVMRVTGQGFLDLRSHELSEGFAHQFVGIVMLIPGFFLLLLVGWFLDKLFIEEADEKRYENKVAVRPKQQNWSLPRTSLAGVSSAGVTAGAKQGGAMPADQKAPKSAEQRPVTKAKSAVYGPPAASLPRTTIPASSVAARPTPRPAIKPPVSGGIKSGLAQPVNQTVASRPTAARTAVKPVVPPRVAPTLQKPVTAKPLSTPEAP